MTEKEKLEKLKKLTDAMYYAAQHLTTDASRLHKAMDDYHRFIVYEYGIKSKNATGKLKEYIDKCKGCNNVKGCVTCVDGSEWAHYEESVSKFDSCVQNSDKVVYNEDMGCRVNLFQLNRVAKVDTPIDYEKALYKHFGQVKDFTLGMRIAKRFYEIGRNYLMKDAIDTVVKVDAGGYPYVDRTIELYDYDKDIPLAKKGDKVKIVVIKED